jgi:DNA adenine methylase
MENPMKPMLKYPGGKSRELEIIAPKNLDLFSSSHIPKFKRYIEPFVGGGALFFDLAHTPSIVNDVNSKLINFYRDIRDNYDLVIEQLNTIKEMYEANSLDLQDKIKQAPSVKHRDLNKELYFELRNEFNKPTGKWLDSVLYYFINRTAFSGAIRYNRSGEFNQSFAFYPSFNIHIKKEHSTLLQNTEIYNDDYSSIFDKVQVDDFIFLDPPYDSIFYEYGNLKTIDDSNEAFQRRLANDYKNLHCPALMVVSKTPLIQELYAHFIKQSYDKRYSVNYKNSVNATAEHVIIKNY